MIETSIAKKLPVPVSALREKMAYDYPQWVIRELMMNAVMHRRYQTNTPTKLYQYRDRLEITNPGGLYGNANADNFPTVNDYRNPVIAEAMKVLGYVNKYNRGIARVNQELEENGNGKAGFKVEKITVFEAIVKIAAKIDEQVDEQAKRKLVTDNNRNTFVQWSKLLTDESKQILSIASAPISKNNIFSKLDITRQTKNSRKYMQPLIKLGLLDTTIKDKVTSPNQQYYITPLGMEFIEFMEREVK